LSYVHSSSSEKRAACGITEQHSQHSSHSSRAGFSHNTESVSTLPLSLGTQQQQQQPAAWNYVTIRFEGKKV